MFAHRRCIMPAALVVMSGACARNTGMPPGPATQPVTMPATEPRPSIILVSAAQDPQNLQASFERLLLARGFRVLSGSPTSSDSQADFVLRYEYASHPLSGAGTVFSTIAATASRMRNGTPVATVDASHEGMTAEMINTLLDGFVARFASSCECGALPAPPPVQSIVSPGVTQELVLGVPSVPTSIVSFVPFIAAVSEGGECRKVEVPNRTIIVLSFPNRANVVRNVSISRDSAGRLINYSDLRGELRQGQTGPLSSVLINFERSNSSAANQHTVGHDGGASGTVEDALHSESLGNPQKMIDLIHARCEVGS